MDRETVKQMRGAADLLENGVEAAVASIEKAQRGVVHRTYTIVAALSHLGAPVRAVESLQQTITDGIYGGIRLGNHAVGAATSLALDCVDARATDEELTETD